VNGQTKAAQWAWLLAFLLPACGEAPDGPTVYPVTGKVFFQGKPATGALVVLHPVGKQGRSYSGEVGFDGSFQITTLTKGDGAPAGTYAVTLTWTETVKVNDAERETPDRFGRRYQDPAKPYTTLEVKPGTNRLPRIDIK
jgi:hypothetical protein